MGGVVSRTVPLSVLLSQTDKWTGGRQPDEIVTKILFPLGETSHGHCKGFKQATRRENSHGVVSAGFRVDLRSQSGVPDKVILAVGGLKRGLYSCTETAALLTSQPWTAATMEAACDTLAAEVRSLEIESYQGQAEYKGTVLLTAFRNFLEESQHWQPKESRLGRLQVAVSTMAGTVGCEVQQRLREVSSGAQSFTVRSDNGGLQTTVGMEACNGKGDMEQSGYKATG